MYKYLITDCDGVLTDGKYYYSSSGKESITFSAKDSLAIKLFKASGVDVIIISSTSYPSIVKQRAEELGIDFYSIKPFEKRDFVESNFDLNEVAYVGDSLDDISLLEVSKLSFAPADAPKLVKDSAKVTLDSVGGTGCILEIYMRKNNNWAR